MLISYLDTTDAKNGIIHGRLAKFTNIDFNLPWFSTENFDAADEVAVSSIHIPDYLKPNYESVSFSFYLSQHTIVFETYAHDTRLTPPKALRFFSNLLRQPELQHDFGFVQVDLISSRENLESLLENPTLHRLEIFVRRPNSPDDFGGLDELFEKGLGEQRASQVELSYTRQPGEYLRPNAQTRAVADLALRNGEVKASVEDGGRIVTRSTTETPQVAAVKYDPESLSAQSAFRRAADKLMTILQIIH